MKIGLLGGSFNPPHQGHLHISKLAIKKLGLNQVWWIPTSYNTLKDRAIYESYQGRVKKCSILTKSHPKIRVKEFDEIYTWKLVSYLQKKYRDVDFFWIMGADSLEKFHRWENFKKLILKIPLVIFSRETSLQKIRKFRIWKFLSRSSYRVFPTKNLDISSTKIRKNSCA